METVVQFFTLDRSLEILGLLIGLLYLYWEYHADSKMWFANIAMPTISFWVYYRAGLYADFAMNIYYFVIAIYGYIIWTQRHTRKTKTDTETTAEKKNAMQYPITHIPKRYLLYCIMVFAAVYAFIATWLILCTDSTVPYFDAFTTALSIIAMWLLARKYIEQWIAWILVDAVTVGLCIYKDRPFYAVLYASYTIIAFFGYAKWKQLMQENARQGVW